MPKPARKSPGVGSNSTDALADHNTIRYALAHQILLNEKKASLQEEVKRARKGFEKKGVSLKDLDEIVRDKDEAESTLVQKLKRKIHYAGALMKRTFQLDLFAGDPDTVAVIYQKGMMAGIEGKEATPPTVYDNAERNTWLEGHAEGADAREQVLRDMEAEAVAGGADGPVVDGSRGAIASRAAAKVGEQAAADFKADNPEAPAGDAAKPPLGLHAVPFEEDKPEDLDKQIQRQAVTGGPEEPAPVVEKPQSQSAKAAAKRAAAKVH